MKIMYEKYRLYTYFDKIIKKYYYQYAQQRALCGLILLLVSRLVV